MIKKSTKEVLANSIKETKNKSNVQKMHIPLSSPKSVIFQAKNGAIELRGDITKETLWATRTQIAQIFEVNPQAISKHLLNIYKEKELKKIATSSKMELVQNENGRLVKRTVDIYNLDMLISIGYRINSKNATYFRIWATKTLKDHITKGYTLNRKVIEKNYDNFINAVNDIKLLLPESDFNDTKNVLELVRGFASTWLTLDSYDKENFKSPIITKKKVTLTSTELNSALIDFKSELISKDEASELFGIDKSRNSLEGIVGNVMQSFGGVDVYKSLEEKAVHLLYFIIKNHPFVDGNKRSGAFAFIWFLNKYKILDTKKISPEGLTAITLLVAESDPKNKDKLIKLIISLLI